MRVLLVEDDADTREVLRSLLERRGARVVTAAAPGPALELLAQEAIDVVVTDLELGAESGLAFCARVAETRRHLPVILLTGKGSLDSAISALRAGAYDFLTKPADAEVLWASLGRATQHHRLQREVQRLRHAVGEAPGEKELLGHSPHMQSVLELLERIAGSDAAVLITGESGTGKELYAHALHQRSRPDGPFVVINCAALPEPLLESELFGHARGAYTDARTARPGLFLRAHGGTLFLDEIGELPMSLQPKLLRALQERKIRPVGADTEIAFDARIVTATNRDLESAVVEKRFRKDLFFRINVITVELPALRDRGTDVLLLAQRFLETFSARAGKRLLAFTPEAQQRLLDYPWPGNVRELQNCVEHAVALCRDDRIRVEELPPRIRDHHGAPAPLSPEPSSDLIPLAEVERRYILRVLDAVGGNKALAARVLQLDRTTLYRKLERYGVGRPHALR